MKSAPISRLSPTTTRCAESTNGLYKTEAINDGGPTWTDRLAVERKVARWVHWYNHQRLHSSIGDLPPLEFEHALPAGSNP